jgi:hypothetical protein
MDKEADTYSGRPIDGIMERQTDAFILGQAETGKQNRHRQVGGGTDRQEELRTRRSSIFCHCYGLFEQGTLTEGKDSVQMNSSLR